MGGSEVLLPPAKEPSPPHSLLGATRGYLMHVNVRNSYDDIRYFQSRRGGAVRNESTSFTSVIVIPSSALLYIFNS